MENEDEILEEFFVELSANQEEMDPEFKKVIRENILQLYEE